MRHFPDSVSLAPGPQALQAQLLVECPELAHVREAAPLIPCLFSQRVLIVHGAPAAAVIVQPRWQGPMANVTAFLFAMFVAAVPGLDGEDPDYLILIDAAIWSGLDPERQERLMFHELKHLAQLEDEFGVPRRGQNGMPLLKLVPHDCEVFHDELLRYGPEVVGIEETLVAIVEGQAHAQRRRRKVA